MRDGEESQDSDWSENEHEDEDIDEMDIDETSGSESEGEEAADTETEVRVRVSAVVDDGIDPSNIITTGRRTRRPTQRYVHPNSNLVVEDVPADELDAALYDSVGSSEDICTSDESDGEDQDFGDEDD